MSIETYATGHDNVVGIRINGMIRKADMEKLVTELKRSLDKSGEMNVVVEMVKFRGVTPHALMKELSFVLPNFDKFKRKAVITDNPVLKRLFGKGEIAIMGKTSRLFDKNTRGEAADWAATGRAPGDTPPKADRARPVEQAPRP